MASTFSFPFVVEGSPRKQLDGIGLKGQYDFFKRGAYQFVAFPVGVLEYASSDITAETDFTADATTSTKFFDARRAIDDPLTLVGPINGSTVYTSTGTSAVTDTGPVRYALGRSDGYGDPVTFYLRGNSVNGVNRAGEVPGTPTGAVRYAPGPGARINRHGNPRLATNSTGWDSYGGTFTRVADTSMGGYAAQQTSTTLNTGLAIRGNTTRALVVDVNVVTVSFDFKWVDGQAGAWYMSFWTTNRGGNGAYYANEGSATIPANCFDGNVYRLSYTVTLKNFYKDSLQVLFLRGTSGITGASTIRVTNLVIEEGKVNNPTYFDGNTEGAVWANHLTGVQGTPHTTSSFTNAALRFEEETTNLIINPNVSQSLNNTVTWQPVTTTLDSGSGYYNAGSIKVVCSGTETYEGYGFSTATLNLAAGTARTYTGSLWVRGTQGESATLVLRLIQNNQATITDTLNTFVFTGSWQRVSATVSANSSFNINSLSVSLLSRWGAKRAQTYWITNAQIEQRPHASSYCDGSLGAGYSWSGTANASSSARVIGYLTIPAYGNASMRKGAVSMWVYVRDTGDTSGASYLFTLGSYNALGLDGIQSSFSNQNGAGFLATSTNNALATLGPTIPINQWVFFYVGWDERSVYCRFNNTSTISTNSRAFPLNVFSVFRIGGTSTLTSADFAVQHFQTYNQPLTDKDYTALYNNGAPLQRYGAGSVPSTYPRMTRINYCRNPRLENGWLDWTSYNGGSYSLVTGNATAKAARITANGLNTGAGFRVKARMSVAYLVSFNARLVRGSEQTWAVGAQAISDDGTVLATPILYNIPRITSTWTRVSTVVLVSHAATESMNILFTPYLDVGGVIDVEQFVVEEIHDLPANYAAPYFDGDTQGSKWADPLMLVPGTAHASPSISAVAPYIEPAATNLLLNPSFEAALGDDVISASGATLQRTTAYAYSGSYSLRVQTSGVAANTEGVILRSARNLGTTTARTFITSIYVRRIVSNASIQVVPFVAYTDGTVVYGSYQVNTILSYWVRYTPSAITTVTNKTLDYVGIHVYATGTTAVEFYVDGAQIEERNHVTSYVDGSLGTGYTWSGTPHASTSTRADSTTQINNAASVISPSTGAIAFWYYRTVTISNTYTLAEIGSYGTNDYIGVFQGPGAPPALRTKNGAATADDVQWGSTPTVLANVWHFVYADWTPTTLRISVDGGTPVTANRTGGVSGAFRSGYSELRLGTNLAGNTYRLFGALSPVQVFNRTLTTTEINDLYTAGLSVTDPISPTQLTAGAESTHNAMTLLTGETEAIPRPNRIQQGVAPDDGQGDLSAAGVLVLGGVSVSDATTDATAVAIMTYDAEMSADGDTEANVTAIASVPDDAYLDAASDLVAVAAVQHNALSANDATSDATSAGKMTYAAFLNTALTLASGFPPTVISGVPLPYLQGTADLGNWVTVADLALPALYVNYQDGGLLLAAGGVRMPAQAAWDATSDCTADAINYVNGEAALSADTDIQTGALWEGTSAIYAVTDITALPAVIRSALSDQTSDSTSTVAAEVLHDALSAMTADTVLAADSIALVPDSVYLASLSNAVATAEVEHIAAADVTADATLNAISTASVPAQSMQSATADVTAQARMTYSATTTCDATLTLNALANVDFVSACSQQANANVNASGARIYQSELGPDGAGTLMADASRIFSMLTDLTSVADAIAEALNFVDGVLLSAGDGLLIAEPLVTNLVIQARQAELIWRSAQITLALEAVQPSLLLQPAQITMKFQPTQASLRSIPTQATLRIIED